MAFDTNLKSDYRTEKGVYYTAALFYDIMYQKDIAKYVVSDEDKEVDGVTYPSLKRLYLEMEDITEYEFANTYLDGWKHWKKMLKSARVRNEIDEWREELELKLMAKGLKSIVEQQESFQAAKFLVDKGWIQDKRTTTAKNKKRSQQAQLSSEYKDDIERMSNLLN